MLSLPDALPISLSACSGGIDQCRNRCGRAGYVRRALLADDPRHPPHDRRGHVLSDDGAAIRAHLARALRSVAAHAGQHDGKRGAAEMRRSEEHTSELQSLMRISYAVFCLKQKTNKAEETNTPNKEKQN